MPDLVIWTGIQGNFIFQIREAFQTGYDIKSVRMHNSNTDNGNSGYTGKLLIQLSRTITLHKLAPVSQIQHTN